MDFKEFWKLYHREDPDEANAHPHRLRIHMRDGTRYEVQFPGSMLATDNNILVGVGPRAKFGQAKSSKYFQWEDIVKIESVEKRSLTKGRR